MATSEVILQVFVIFVAAKVAAELATRLDQPPVIGELLVGIFIGPHALGLVGLPGPSLAASFHDATTAQEVLHFILDILAEIGVIVLLFVVGLETRLSDILQVGNRAVLVAVGGIVLPFALGFGFGAALGQTAFTALFIGAALVATSIGITARVLGDLRQLQTRAARIILGAAVVDDIVGMVILAVVAGLASGSGLSFASVVALVAEALGFTLFVILVGRRLIERYSAHFSALHLRNAPFTVALGLCLGLAALAGQIGLAAIIGAFLAGLIFAESRERDELRRQAQPIHDFLVPYFFVVTGTRVDPTLLLDPSIVEFAAVLTVLAVLGKLIGAGLGAVGLGPHTVAIVGVGMVPRGEVGLLVAGIGQATGAIPEAVFSIVVMMSIVTTLIVPPVLKLLVSSTEEGSGSTKLDSLATKGPGEAVDQDRVD